MYDVSRLVYTQYQIFELFSVPSTAIDHMMYIQNQHARYVSAAREGPHICG
jgi:hypothetical protein